MNLINFSYKTTRVVVSFVKKKKKTSSVNTRFFSLMQKKFFLNLLLWLTYDHMHLQIKTVKKLNYF